MKLEVKRGNDGSICLAHNRSNWETRLDIAAAVFDARTAAWGRKQPVTALPLLMALRQVRRASRG